MLIFVVYFYRQGVFVSNSLFFFSNAEIGGFRFFYQNFREFRQFFGAFLDKLLLFSNVRIKKPGMDDPVPVEFVLFA